MFEVEFDPMMLDQHGHFGLSGLAQLDCCAEQFLIPLLALLKHALHLVNRLLQPFCFPALFLNFPRFLLNHLCLLLAFAVELPCLVLEHGILLQQPIDDDVFLVQPPLVVINRGFTHINKYRKNDQMG